jgi:hypothetical protein
VSTYSATSIRSAIRSLLEGELGAIRTLPPGTFKYGVFEGQPAGAVRAKTNDPSYAHRFDCKIGGQRMHTSTPISAKSSYKTVAVPVSIDIFTGLQSTPLDDRRDAQRNAIEEDIQLAVQALEYPGNLTLDSNGNATGIVSGILMGPNGYGHPTAEVVSEDWKQLLHKSRISGAVVVVVDQRVSA